MTDPGLKSKSHQPVSADRLSPFWLSSEERHGTMASCWHHSDCSVLMYLEVTSTKHSKPTSLSGALTTLMAALAGGKQTQVHHLLIAVKDERISAENKAVVSLRSRFQDLCMGPVLHLLTSNNVILIHLAHQDDTLNEEANMTEGISAAADM